MKTALTRLATAGALALVLLSPACIDPLPTDPASGKIPTSIMPGDPPAEVVTQGAANDIARAVAKALASPTLRLQVLNDMRVSPYAGHSLDLGRHLDRSERFRKAFAAQAERGPETMERVLDGGVQWRLEMPGKRDRAQWRGTQNFVVAASTAPLDADHPDPVITGYRLDGTPVDLDSYNRFEHVLFIVHPSAPDQPLVEEHRSAAYASVAAGQGTISSVHEEYEVSADCEPGTGPAGDPCNPRGGGSGELRLPVQNGWNLADCRNTGMGGGDSDGDGLNDQCEYDVAWSFSPALMIDRADNTSRDEYWVVMPGDGNRIMVFYAFGYYIDLGTPFPIFRRWFTNHNGDSEFVVFELAPSHVRGRTWALSWAFLSAHYGKNWPAVDSSELVRGGGMEVASDGRPLVWVAKWKHANYVSQDACDSGARFNADTCDNNNLSTRFWVHQDGNLGQVNRRTYSSCNVPSRDTWNASRTECFWTTGNFHGWRQRTDDGAGPYRSHMGDFGFDQARASIGS